MFNLFQRQDEHKYNIYIREKIKEAREEKGMTQAELAKQIDKSQVNISNIENGRLEVSAVDLMGIAYILEKPVKYFFPVFVPSEGDLADYEWEVVHFLRKIGGEERTRIVAALIVKELSRIVDVIIDADIDLMHKAREIMDEIEKANPKGKKPKK